MNKITENKIEFDRWKTTLHDSYTGIKFYIENAELHGITYPHLNIIKTGLRPVDADVTTHIYSKESGFVRTSSISP